MQIRRLWLGFALAAIIIAACKAPERAPRSDGASAGLLSSAGRFYEAYARDLQGGHRTALAHYYAPEGAVVVLAGQREHRSRADMDSIYRSAWSPPAYFAWDDLAFDSLGPDRVLVTGAFLWRAPGSPDTSRFVYAALLEAVDSGLALRFEHETPWPKAQ